MSLLHQPSNGILETHVTWDDIQQKLLETFGPRASLGPKKSAIELSNERGFLSKVARIDPDWLDQDDGLPKDFVVKILSLLTISKIAARAGDKISDEKQKEQEEKFTKLHNLELSTYEKISSFKNLPTLKFYGGMKFTEENRTKGFILLEFVDCLHSIHAHSKFTDDQVAQMISWLAKFHALSLQLSEEEAHQMKKAVLSDGYGAVLHPDLLKHSLPRFKELLPIRDDIYPKLIECGKTLGQPEMMRFIDDSAEILDMPRVLCHGDPWTPNLLFVPNGDDILLKGVVDFQNAHYGCAGFDLARLFTSILDKNQLENVENYLRLYHMHVTEQFGREVFSKEQVIEAYYRFEPAIAFMHSHLVCSVGRGLKDKGLIEDGQQAINACNERAECLIMRCINEYPKLQKKFEDWNSMEQHAE